MRGGWHSFRDAPPVRTAGGWCYKTACLVHMQQHGEVDSLQWSLERLRWHPGLRAALQDVEQRYSSHGLPGYAHYFPGQ